MKIWDESSIKKALNIEVPFNFNATGFEFNSKDIKPGFIFIALKGENGDGHDYINSAFENGAVAAIVHKLPERNREKCILVKDTKEALLTLANFKRNNSRAKFIGITGSVGKTTTKEMAALAFEAFGKVHKNRVNFNNDIGVPITLSQMPDDAEYAIIEMGMSAKNEILYLTKIVEPDVAIITTIEPVHLEHFESISGITDAKSEIFHGTKSHRVGIINADNAEFERMKSNAKKYEVENLLTFARDNSGNAKLLEAQVKDNTTYIKANIDNKEISYSINIPGEHHAMNTLPVLLAVHALNLDIEKAANKLTNIEAVVGRGQLHELNYSGKKITIIDESYNSNPAAVKAALKVMKMKYPHRRKIALLADMKELGSTTIELHKDLLPNLESCVDKVGLVGEVIEHLFNVLPENLKLSHYKTVENLLESTLFEMLENNDVLLIKGSNSMKMSKIVAYFLAKNGKENVVLSSH
ncbi:MAG: UDP-N-acetylmuramoyl-tripeptide--D-alanyl-D-alanine ligase [Sphingobacteriia bacterium]|nr:UDP-N-acetylmuramoyl-tripeptide--D-alanyl-D-alanine ligase [Sphingobacteriia bacterium]